MSKLPSFQFYPADWKKDPGIQALEFFDRHVWFEILLLMHESPERGVLLLNGVPMPDDACARALGLDPKIFQNSLSKLLAYGVAERRKNDGAIVNRRMVRDEKIRKIRKKSGFLGGNPRLKKRNDSKAVPGLVNQNPTTGVNQILTPSSSSSSSSSSSVRTKNVDTLCRTSSPAPLVAGCVFFRMGVNEKNLVEAWYKKNGFSIDLIPEAIQIVESWMALGSKAGARAARKLPNHHRQLYASWVLDKLGTIVTARRRLSNKPGFDSPQLFNQAVRSFKGPLPTLDEEDDA